MSELHHKEIRSAKGFKNVTSLWCVRAARAICGSSAFYAAPDISLRELLRRKNSALRLLPWQPPKPKHKHSPLAYNSKIDFRGVCCCCTMKGAKRALSLSLPPVLLLSAPAHFTPEQMTAAMRHFVIVYILALLNRNSINKSFNSRRKSSISIWDLKTSFILII